MPPSRRSVLATAGHVDHGKTSLVLALTGTDTDRLPEEKRRGISIELGFAELPGHALSFIDVPGHYKLVPKMIAGVGGVGGLLLVVAADDGVMPQTREHLAVASLLGVEHVVVALSKVDLVDEETCALAHADVEEALEAQGMRAQAIIPTSVVTGQGLEQLREALVQLADNAPRPDLERRAWLALDRVFSIKGAGTVVTGTLTSGKLVRGAEVFVVGSRGRTSTFARDLNVHGRSVSEALAPTRLAINLARVSVDQVQRGDVLTDDAELLVSRRFDMRLQVAGNSDWQPQAPAATTGTPVIAHLGTTRVGARVVQLGTRFAHVSLEHAVPLKAGLGVVFRGFSSSRAHGNVLAGGRVIDAASPKLPHRRHSEPWQRREALLQAAWDQKPEPALEGLLALALPRGIVAREVEQRFGWQPGSIAALLGNGKVAKRLGAVALTQGSVWVAREALELGQRHLMELLDAHHQKHPEEAGLPLETARKTLARRAGAALAEAVLQRGLAQGGVMAPQSGLLASTAFVESTGQTAEGTREAVFLQLQQRALQGASVAELERDTQLPPEWIRSALGHLSGQQRARRLGQLWFSETVIDALRARVQSFFQTRESLSVADFKDLTGAARRQAIPLLEHFDREGTTRRVGDQRLPGARSTKARA